MTWRRRSVPISRRRTRPISRLIAVKQGHNTSRLPISPGPVFVAETPWNSPTYPTKGL